MSAGTKSENFFKKHVDTIVVLTGILGSVLWMNGKLNGIENRLNIIETVLIMKDVMPKELCGKGQK